MREKHITLTDPGEATAGRWQGLRFGSESCPHLLPPPEAMERIRGESAGRALALVTPVCGPGESEDVAALADRALELEWDEVVVNDWGILSGLSPRWKGRLSAGRCLVGLRRGPGLGDPWAELDDESRRYFAWGPLYDSALLELFSERGIVRLEVDPPRHWFPLPDMNAFRISFHGDFRLVSLSARCPWLYEGSADRWADPDPRRRGCLESGPVLMFSGYLTRPLIHRGREILEEASDAWSEEDLADGVDRIIYSNLDISGTGSAYNTDEPESGFRDPE
ncbi:MAG: hypothetical protein JSV26_04910 [bacterium]|nr:MAG: hypothetical protein JSV26_04910 [bacterium]